MAVVADVWDELVADIRDNRVTFATYSAYFDGIQKLPIDTAEFRSKFGQVFSSFRANLARPVIEAVEGRLRFAEFGDGTSEAAQRALEIFEDNEMDREYRWVHTEALVTSRAFVIVMPTEDGPGIFPHAAHECAVVYDPDNPRRKLAGLKWWIEDVLEEGHDRPSPYCRVNVYFEDRVERFISKASTTDLETDLGRMDPYGEPTPHNVGEVPVFPFYANYGLHDREPRSDLADALGYIDAITKTILDLLVSSEFTAAPQRWATGVEIPLDPKTGEPIETYKAGSNKLWTAPADTAKFGQFNGADLAGFNTALTALVERLAFDTRTPLHFLMSEDSREIPSGDARKTAESAFRQRVMDHQEDFGIEWPKVVRAALRIDSEFEADPDEVRLRDLRPSWVPANAPFATKELLEEVKVKVEVAGVPEEMAWRELGYTAAQIEEMRQMREEEAALGQDPFADAQAAAILNGAPSAGEVVAGLGDDVGAGAVEVEVEDPTLAPE